MRGFLRSLVPVVFLIALAPGIAFAQAHRAAIRGIVVDPAGQRMRGVEVRVMNEDTRESRHVKTDHEGRYTVAQIPPGVYRLTVDHPGYGRFIARTELAMNQDYWLDVALQTGKMIQAVDVVAPFLPSDHDHSALHTFVTARDLDEWPVESGSFLELALLAAETARAPQGSPTLRRGRFAMNVAGARDDFNDFVLDGVNDIDPASNTPVVLPPRDAIRQFQVFTSGYDASFGRGAGGQVSVVTKSGTNAFRGSLYELARGTALGGRNHFAPKTGAPPAYARNQFGATIGGPLAKNHTFFFADYERTHLREGITRVTNVPTLAERGGDFSQTLLPKPINPATGERFAGDTIPGNRLSDTGRAAAALYPEPNRDTPFANYVSSPVRHDDVDHADVRLDQALGNGARLTARYSITDQRLFQPFGGPGAALVPGFGRRLPMRGQNAALTLTHAPPSSLVNDLRLGYTRVSEDAVSETSSPLLLRVPGYSPIGRQDEPRESTIDAVQVSDTVTYSHGHHTVRAGAEWYGIERRTSSDDLLRGFLPFGRQSITGNGLADLLLGFTGGSLAEPIGYPPTLQTSTTSAFLQNDWRPASTVAVSAGLRYEYTTPPVDPQDRPRLYDPATRSLVRVGMGGMPRGGYVADSNNFAPRVGVAWTVGADRMNVIRAGYGVYYNEPSLASSGLVLPIPFGNPLAEELAALGILFVPPSAVSYQRDLATARIENWNVNLQHQLGQSRAFEFAYVGARGKNLLAARDINQPPASPNRVNLRPDTFFADVTLIESRATSEYNGFHIRFQQRPATGTSMLATYTVGKSVDDASGFLPSAGDANFPQNSLDVRAERARSSFDVRHRFSGAVIRPLPFNKGQFLGKLGFISRALADSDLEAVATFETGRPFTVAILPGIDNSNTGASRFGYGTNDRPNVSGSAALGRGTESAWFKTSAFSMPPFGTFGNSGRNTQTGPGYKNINAALVRHIRLGTRDRATIDLRLEAFNLLGTVNYDLPDAFLGSPTFGRILSAGSPRRVQFGVKAIF